MIKQDQTQNKEELQQRYMQLQLLEQQIKQVQKQLQTITSQLNELAYSVQSLEEFKNVKVGSEIFVPVVTGIFAKAEIKEIENVNINVGSNIAVSKSLADSKKILEDQFQELDNIRVKLSNDLQKMIAQAQLLQQQIMISQKT